MDNMNLTGEAGLPHKVLSLAGKELYIYREISSTNNVARMLAQEGAPEGTIVMSRSQSAGRGRMSRRWLCPPGRGILISIILRPKIAGQYIPLLTLLTGVAIAEAIKKITGCAAGIKWPNDIVIGHKKVCGIIAEGNLSKNTPNYIIIGSGINVNLEKDELPPDCQDTSTSLKIETGHRVSRVRLLQEYVLTWDYHYQEFLQQGAEYVLSNWIKNNVTLGRDIIIGNETACGVAVDISTRGGLVVRLSNGDIKEYLAEDISIGRNFYGNSAYSR